MKRPEHYTKHGDFEPIKIIKAYLTDAEYYGWLYGSAITYLLRHRDKNSPCGDLAKAITFVNWMMDEHIPETSERVTSGKPDKS